MCYIVQGADMTLEEYMPHLSCALPNASHIIPYPQGWETHLEKREPLNPIKTLSSLRRTPRSCQYLGFQGSSLIVRGNIRGRGLLKADLDVFLNEIANATLILQLSILEKHITNASWKYSASQLSLNLSGH